MCKPLLWLDYGRVEALTGLVAAKMAPLNVLFIQDEMKLNMDPSLVANLHF